MMEVYKAESIGKVSEVPNLVLIAKRVVPAYETRMAAVGVARSFFQAQAEIIMGALLKSLPGGTISSLTVELLKHEISVRIVPDICSTE